MSVSRMEARFTVPLLALLSLSALKYSQRTCFHAYYFRVVNHIIYAAPAYLGLPIYRLVHTA
jgi:hypothetical protein